MQDKLQNKLGHFLRLWLLASVLGCAAYYYRYGGPAIKQERIQKAAEQRWQQMARYERKRWKVYGLDGRFEQGETANSMAFLETMGEQPKQLASFGEKHPWPSAGQLVIDDIIRLRRRRDLAIELFAPESMGGLPDEELLIGEWVGQVPKQPHTVNDASTDPVVAVI